MMTDSRVLEQLGGTSTRGLAVLAVVLGLADDGPVEPKPPAMTEMNDRFIALHMM
jgi:hypothetical protein